MFIIVLRTAVCCNV